MGRLTDYIILQYSIITQITTFSTERMFQMRFNNVGRTKISFFTFFISHFPFLCYTVPYHFKQKEHRLMRKFLPYQQYDVRAIEEWLNKQSMAGYRLVKMDGVFPTFKKYIDHQ